MTTTTSGKLYIGQVLPFFLWGLLLHAGLSALGLAGPLENQILGDLGVPSYLTLSVILVISLLVFLYPLIQGIRGLLRAGIVGIIGMIVAFLGGYFVLERWQVGLVLLVGGMVLWLLGRLAVRRRTSRVRSVNAK